MVGEFAPIPIRTPLANAFVRTLLFAPIPYRDGESLYGLASGVCLSYLVKRIVMHDLKPGRILGRQVGGVVKYAQALNA